MNVESPAYMKVQLHQMDFQIPGYWPVHTFSFVLPFLFLSAHLCSSFKLNMLPFPLVFQNGATHCTSELSVMKNNEIHSWDKGYDDDGNQVSFNGSVFHCGTYKNTPSVP